jgi:hypothetical protein
MNFQKAMGMAASHRLKILISDSSNLIIAPVKTSLEFYSGNENKIITLCIGSEYLFSKEGNDFIVYGGLSLPGPYFLFLKKIYENFNHL